MYVCMQFLCLILSNRKCVQRKAIIIQSYAAAPSASDYHILSVWVLGIENGLPIESNYLVTGYGRCLHKPGLHVTSLDVEEKDEDEVVVQLDDVMGDSDVTVHPSEPHSMEQEEVFTEF